MKGKTQLPHFPEGEVEGATVEVKGATVEDPLMQLADSSPSPAKENLLLVMTAALLETPGTPVDVPVTG